jgi:hypothetical protein
MSYHGAWALIPLLALPVMMRMVGRRGSERGGLRASGPRLAGDELPGWGPQRIVSTLKSLWPAHPEGCAPWTMETKSGP